MFNPNSTQVLERLIGMVPPEEKRLVTAQLAEAVVAIVAQKLASTKDGKPAAGGRDPPRRPVLDSLHPGEPLERPE